MTAARRAIRRRLADLAAKIGSVGTALEIGIAGNHPKLTIDEFFKAERYYTLDKDARLQPDLLCDLEQPSAIPTVADLVVCSQVLEHCWNFRAALESLFDMTDMRGGQCIIDTPFKYEVHSDDDYWRFTPHAMNRLVTEAGFEVMDGRADPDQLIVSFWCRRPTETRIAFVDTCGLCKGPMTAQGCVQCGAKPSEHGLMSRPKDG